MPFSGTAHLCRYVVNCSDEAKGKSTGQPRSNGRVDLGELGSSTISQGSTQMNWDRVEGNWKQFSGKVKEKWGKLTDDDLQIINGQQEQLIGRIQERYGVAKDDAQKQVKNWVGGL
jgi:uncharacterized protein YjbJ (UPF0337 family)